MRDLSNCKNVEPLALLEQMEIMQAELEQLPTLSEWQNVQELLQEQATQIQEQSLTIRQQAEQIEKLSANDSYLTENQKLKKENVDLAARIKTAESEKASALAQADYAKKHVRTEQIKVPTYFSKCNVCKEESLMKEIEKQKQKQKKLRCYLLVFEVLVGIVIVFTAFREETFWNDFKAFFTGLWDILSVNGTALYKGYSALSQLAVCGIEKGVLQDVLYWVLLLLLYLITFGGMFLLIRCMWNSWKEKVLESINPWVASASIILLLIVVYLGEFIKMLLPMNLLGLWILGTIAIIGISMYVMDCIRYRR